MYRDEGEDCGVAIAGRVSTRASTGTWLGLDTAALEAGDGPFVVDLYETIANGKKTQHLDIFEVRNGKVVREWEY